MKFTPLDEGFIVRLPDAPGPGSVAVGPRAVVLSDGGLLCSASLTSGLGVNDFYPVLYRSGDLGRTWAEQAPLWPHLRDKWSIFVSLSPDAAGRLFLFGSRSPIKAPGETFWSDATQGIKQNELIWAASDDGGRTWAEPAVIPMPIPGSAEAPSGICVTRGGRWLAPYSPYNTFDPNLRVDRSQVVVVHSDDGGRTWGHTAMLRFADADSGGAEAWVVELGDDVLLGTAWNISFHGGSDLPNAYALSRDGGRTWCPTRSTGLLGQSTALSALPDGRGLFIYNQRRHGEPGVWLAVVRPTDTDFGIEANEIVWRAQTRTQSETSGEHAEWSDFSFGEPCVVPLPDGTLFVALWCLQPAARGIRYVKLRLSP